MPGKITQTFTSATWRHLATIYYEFFAQRRINQRGNIANQTTLITLLKCSVSPGNSEQRCRIFSIGCQEREGLLLCARRRGGEGAGQCELRAMTWLYLFICDSRLIVVVLWRHTCSPLLSVHGKQSLRSLSAVAVSHWPTAPPTEKNMTSSISTDSVKVCLCQELLGARPCRCTIHFLHPLFSAIKYEYTAFARSTMA